METLYYRLGLLFAERERARRLERARREAAARVADRTEQAHVEAPDRAA